MTSPSCLGIVEKLHKVLLEIEKTPYPYIPNPPGCKKRASVACIIRVSPMCQTPQLKHHSTRPVSSSRERINEFFAQGWARSGDPEILFIRRAARTGDRWTSQVALPGGKRDPDDTDDLATSVRETQEEVGLDLNASTVIPVGKLPGRIITTEWGTVPLMVLSPFVYLMTEPEASPLTLQPTEIASAHWVSIRALLEQSLWTYERADMSDRYAKRGGLVSKYTLRFLFGQMLFGAIRLRPSESVFTKIGSDAQRMKPRESSLRLANVWPAGSKDVDRTKSEDPLLLWGLTHGIIIDLLRLLPDSNLLASWRWPTFSAWDVRLLIWLVSFKFRSQKLLHTSSSRHGPFAIIEEGFATVDEVDPKSNIRLKSRSLDDKELDLRNNGSKGITQHSAVHFMLNGYFDLVRRGIFLSLALRIVFGLSVTFYLIRRSR